MQHKNIDPDELERPDWNSLLNNYSKHDIGEAYFKGRVEQIGYHVEHWGIDRRHHDDHLIFDDKMDLRLWEPMGGQEMSPEWPDSPDAERVVETFDIGIDTIEREWQLRAVTDVKTKASKSWFGRFNLRHLAHYTHWADHYDVPAFVYMTMVDPDAEQVGEMEFLTPLDTDWDYEALLDYYDNDKELSYGDIKDIARGADVVERTFRAPDGNLVIEVPDDERYNWDWFVSEVVKE